MGKNVYVILATILVFLVVADVSNALNLRKLVDSPPNQPGNSSSDVPILSPKIPVKQSSPVGKEKKIEPPPASQTGKDNSSKDKEVTKDTDVTPPPVDVKEHVNNGTGKEAVKDKGKESEGKEGAKETEKSAKKEVPKEEPKVKEKEKTKEKEEHTEEQTKREKEDSKTNDSVGSGESCDAMKPKCEDSKSSITACIKSVDSKALVLLIQNKGSSSLKVTITTSPSRNKQQVIDIPKLQSKLVNLADTRLNEITLTAGNGNCVLHLGAPISQGNFIQWMPSYSKFMTPIYGAYLILAITFIAGGVWACCWFTKRKGHRGIAYQELEMSRPESAVAVETAEGWDEVWDDDWDEENAVRSPGGRSISAKGLTSRNLKKDDWEDWDD